MIRTIARSVATTAALAVLSMGVHAADGEVGTCGWGSKVFDGQSGLPAKVLAVTTNGTSGSQTFGITSGTSGCTQDGTVRSSWKLSSFIEGNKEKLARDMSRGSGETLDALAQLIGVEAQDKAAFVRSTRENVGRIFPSADVPAQDVRVALRQVMADDERLAVYMARI
jgi:hypothetical protein